MAFPEQESPPWLLLDHIEYFHYRISILQGLGLSSSGPNPTRTFQPKTLPLAYEKASRAFVFDLQSTPAVALEYQNSTPTASTPLFLIIEVE